jgi:hypothetical protein
MDLKRFVAYWREECGFGMKALVAVIAGGILMLLAKLMGFHLVKLPGGFEISGAPSQVSKDPKVTDVSAQKV